MSLGSEGCSVETGTTPAMVQTSLSRRISLGLLPVDRKRSLGAVVFFGFGFLGVIALGWHFFVRDWSPVLNSGSDEMMMASGDPRLNPKLPERRSQLALSQSAEIAKRRSGPPFLIFSIPRPYEGPVGQCQDMALQNWRVLKPKPRVWLFANELTAKGVTTHAGTSDVRLISNFSLNQYGVPLLADPFRMATESGLPILVYSNSDLIYTSKFTRILAELWERFKGTEFFAIGRRNDISRTKELRGSRTLDDFEESLENVSPLTRNFNWVDYFVFTPGVFTEALPDLTVGRNYFDWWLLFHVFRNPMIQVIDMQNRPMVYHAKHSYGHVVKNEKYNTTFTHDTPSRGQAPDSMKNLEIFLKEVDRYYKRAANETDMEYLARWKAEKSNHLRGLFPVPRSAHMWNVVPCPDHLSKQNCFVANTNTMNNDVTDFLLSRSGVLKNKHLGEKCALIGCNPESDWSPMEGMTIFSYCPTQLRSASLPIHYVYHESWRTLSNAGTQVMESNATKLLPLAKRVMSTYREHLNNTYFFKPLGEGRIGFSSDPPRGHQQRAGAPFAVLQLAYWMGCQTVYMMDTQPHPRELAPLPMAQKKFGAAHGGVFDGTADGSWPGLTHKSLYKAAAAARSGAKPSSGGKPADKPTGSKSPRRETPKDAR